jgi:hypothetical protein
MFANLAGLAPLLIIRQRRPTNSAVPIGIINNPSCQRRFRTARAQVSCGCPLDLFLLYIVLAGHKGSAVRSLRGQHADT